jgi:hypothetical protein
MKLRTLTFIFKLINIKEYNNILKEKKSCMECVLDVAYACVGSKL